MASELRDAASLAAAPAAQASRRGAEIVVRGLDKAFGSRHVLRGVDLSLAPGEFMTILGPSGGGKTTLLRLVAGLDEPSNGTIELRRPDGGPATVRMMFQEDRLLPWRRVLDNVGLGLPANERESRARAALGSVGLADRAADWPAVLSGGQRQRVALARALVHRPDLLLLDEPFGALDALTRAGMQRLLEQLWQRQGCTVLLVTHDVEEALLLADRVVVLLGGVLASDTRVTSPRPRHAGDPALAARKEQLLEQLLAADEAAALQSHNGLSSPNVHEEEARS